MDRAPLPDLNSLDRDALLALYLAQQEQQKRLDAMLAAREEELRHLEAELEVQRQTLSRQADELRSGSERIEHLKLKVEKLRHLIFGARSEKIVDKLEQLELDWKRKRPRMPTWKLQPSACRPLKNRRRSLSASLCRSISRVK